MGTRNKVVRAGLRFTTRGPGDDLMTDVIHCLSENRIRVTDFRTIFITSKMCFSNLPLTPFANKSEQRSEFKRRNRTSPLSLARTVPQFECPLLVTGRWLFLRNKPFDSCGFGVQQRWNRYISPVPNGRRRCSCVAVGTYIWESILPVCRKRVCQLSDSVSKWGVCFPTDIRSARLK